MRDILNLKDVSLIYHSAEEETLAIKNISFNIKEGEFISIVGPSGCGKTSILSMIAGLLSPTDGIITLDGQEIKKPGTDIGYMLQKDQLFPWRTIYKNIVLGLEIKKEDTQKNKAYIEDLIKKYGLSEFINYYPHQLSGGMRQRAALIRTLATGPKVLLLDEPFSALDYQTRIEVCDDVYSIITKENKTAILVTHDIAEAISISDRILVLSKRPAELKSEYKLNFREFGTPLKRREHKDFPILFEQIWRDISDGKQ